MIVANFLCSHSIEQLAYELLQTHLYKRFNYDQVLTIKVKASSLYFEYILLSV